LSQGVTFLVIAVFARGQPEQLLIDPLMMGEDGVRRIQTKSVQDFMKGICCGIFNTELLICSAQNKSVR
jgi:hypothetical protein